MDISIGDDDIPSKENLKLMKRKKQKHQINNFQSK